MALTVRQLREQLGALPGEADDWPVVPAKDAEGNGYSPLEELTPGQYKAVTMWHGEFSDYGPRSKDNALCLWPVG